MLSPWRVAAPNSRSKVRGWRGSPSPQRQSGHRDIVRQTADDNGWTLDSGYEGDDFPSFESYRRGDGEELAVWYTHPGGKVYRALQKTLHSFDQNGKPFHVINKLQSEPNKKQWVIDALSEPAWTPIRKAHKIIQAATASVEDDIMELIGPPVRPHNPATDLPPAPRRDPYEEMRDLYKDRPQGKIKYDLMIPTDIVNHYREHDRDYDDRLEQVIREQGIRQPVHISTDGTHAILNEGNHRLDIAQKLGIPEIPARIFVDDKVIRGDNRYGKPPVPLEPFLKKFIDTNRGRLESFWG